MSDESLPAPRAGAPGPGARIGGGTLLQVGLAVLLAFLCLAPFALIVAISFGEKVQGAAWIWSVDPGNYARVFVGALWPEEFSGLYLQRLWYSVLYATLGAVLAVATAFPFTWFLTRTGRRAQTIWLVFLLSSVSVSEVFVVMGWDILLSNRSGLPMVARETGLTDWLKAVGWFDTLRGWGLANPRDLKFKTSATATVLTMTYLVWPYAVILLYPPLSRLDPALTEAARTMGARPATVIRTVVLPVLRLPLLGAVMFLFVYLLGVYVTVSVFAAPSQQTLAVSIYDAVRGATLDAPFGAAQSVVLLAVAALCLWFGQRLGGRGA
ncbi:putative spermidine/putrescine transport system permease protein [Palleronia aestuarii]|uniref:Putative spermidine/putrescine transport system permease protein n=1 Tax=Palleronia aestuarii TaxID=568105 RepID=A0A2W7N076_9RHOB|nr:hypothetical protein [Palleronia aestuarii]PZX13470.1 putative spermidine/putrescine transport system permease protein [Palleronia aestuarii]